MYTQEEIITKFKKVHNNLYDYSKVIFTNTKKNVNDYLISSNLAIANALVVKAQAQSPKDSLLGNFSAAG